MYLCMGKKFDEKKKKRGIALYKSPVWPLVLSFSILVYPISILVYFSSSHICQVLSRLFFLLPRLLLSNPPLPLQVYLPAPAINQFFPLAANEEESSGGSFRLIILVFA